MDAGRDATLLGLLREGSGPLSDFVWTLEVRRKAGHEHAGGDAVKAASDLFSKPVVLLFEAGSYPLD
ncbi:hypothetical protein GCM10007209_36110 [Haloferax sulfurifontis]|uniref:Uncharacterized protein n=1 Tax=Haloferax sulfurifontis TaxID=255616 RepID=A0A830DY96_9EURY|nr:hypothetical protein GCM10007209_36110 [Haloferax sulfurifontis]